METESKRANLLEMHLCGRVFVYSSTLCQRFCGYKMKKAVLLLCRTDFTLFAQASSSHVVSCKTLMISLISALIFSKINLRFFSASSMPAPRLLLVATKIFIAVSKKFDLITIIAR